MATANKFLAFTDDLAEGIHTLASDQLVFALTAAANAPVNTNTVLANLTEITYTNLSTRNITTSSSTQTAGQYSLVNADLVISASGGAANAFRYLCMYNDTASSPLVDPLVLWWDYGSDLTLGDGESLTADFGANTFTLGA